MSKEMTKYILAKVVFIKIVGICTSNIVQVLTRFTGLEWNILSLRNQSYPRFEGGTGVGAIVGSSRTSTEEVRLDP